MGKIIAMRVFIAIWSYGFCYIRYCIISSASRVTVHIVFNGDPYFHVQILQHLFREWLCVVEEYWLPRYWGLQLYFEYNIVLAGHDLQRILRQLLMH